MRTKIQRIFGVIRSDQHLWEVVRGASSALVIRILGTVLGFIVSVAIARMLGAEGSGVYYLALSVATIAATIGRVGFDNTVVRFIASHASVQEWGAVRFVYRTSMKVVVAASLLISVVLFLGAEWFANALFDKPYMEIPLRLASISVLPLSLAIIQAENLRGLKNISASQWITTVLTPLGTILLLYPLVYLWGANGAVAAYVVATGITAMAAWMLLQNAWLNRAGEANLKLNLISVKSLFQSSWPLYGVALTGLVMHQAATIFLGIWGTADEIGIFNVASRLSSLLLFPLIAMISILAPKFAAMHKQGDMDGLKQLAHDSSRVQVFFAVPVAVLVALSSEWILKLFGGAFADGALVLIILLVGVAINAATGAVANLLMMSGHETAVRNSTILVSLLLLTMYAILIPKFGMVGAAITTSLGMLTQNMILAWKVKRYLGFFPVSIYRKSST